MDPLLSHIFGCYNLVLSRHLIVIIWTLQSLTLLLPVANTASIGTNANQTNSLDDYPYQQIPAPRPLLVASHDFDSSVESTCVGCKLGDNGRMCSGHAQGECDCSSSNVICRCKSEWTGDACQYLISKIYILIDVYGTGPLAEGKDCQYFCYHHYPTPVIVKNLHFQDDEHLCSFIHHVEAATSAGSLPEECRYFFKFGPILYDGSIDSSNLYVVAQQDMDCGKPAKYPSLSPVSKNNDSFQIFAKNYDEVVRTSDINDPGQEFKRKNNFFVVVVIFVFIALPFVTCAFSLIYNFSNLPCGLCNKFRQPSSKYIRNVRPFPGYISNDEVSAYFRNDERSERESELSEIG